MLLAKNAYVNSKTKAGWTPLHFVAFKGFNEMINPLVSKHNAAIDATSMVSFLIGPLTLCQIDFNSTFLGNLSLSNIHFWLVLLKTDMLLF